MMFLLCPQLFFHVVILIGLFVLYHLISLRRRGLVHLDEMGKEAYLYQPAVLFRLGTPPPTRCILFSHVHHVCFLKKKKNKPVVNHSPASSLLYEIQQTLPAVQP